MGLDMFLNKRTYIGAQYQHNKVKGEINITKEGKVVPIRFDKVENIQEAVGYWRKANHIHDWFVNNVQNGVDDCGYYPVDVTALEQLLNLCQQVIEDPSKGPELLPTTEGFFFGSTDYEEYYLECIHQAIDGIDRDDYDVDFIYHSSW